MSSENTQPNLSLRLKVQSHLSQHAIAWSIVVCTMLCAVGLISIRLVAGMNATPTWWESISTQQSASIDQASLVESGVILENAITTQLTMIRDDESSWMIAINEPQVNAWLATRFQDTIETHMGSDAWPSEIGLVRFALVGDRMFIGFRLLHTHGSMIVWGRAELSVDQQGDLWVKLWDTHLGTSSVPMGLARVVIDHPIQDSWYKVGPAELDLQDGRLVRLIAIRVHEGRLELVLQTQYTQSISVED